MRRPRFVIVNDCDAPTRMNVAEWKDGIGYCYMSRDEDKMRKGFDGMRPENPTPLEDFGYAVLVRGNVARFVSAGESVAAYSDGKPRKWQDIRGADGFTLPLVGRVTRRGSQHVRAKL